MEADNFDRTLTAFKRRSPFRPFTGRATRFAA